MSLGVSFIVWRFYSMFPFLLLGTMHYICNQCSPRATQALHFPQLHYQLQTNDPGSPIRLCADCAKQQGIIPGMRQTQLNKRTRTLWKVIGVVCQFSCIFLCINGFSLYCFTMQFCLDLFLLMVHMETWTHARYSHADVCVVWVFTFTVHYIPDTVGSLRFFCCHTFS